MKSMKKQVKSILLDAGFILVGSALTAFAIAVFTVPNNIAPGGVSGIATAISHLTDWPVGVLSLLLNIPLMAVGLKKLGFLPLVKTIAATVLLSVGIDLFMAYIPPYTNNTLLAAFMGGAIMGAGMGLLLVRGISTGGTDLIGLMIHRGRSAMSLGQILMIIDTVVVVFAVVVFRDVDVALYSVVTIYMASKTVDVIQAGTEHQKIIYIVSDRADEILRVMVDDWGRGVTVLDAEGGYTKEPKKMLMTIARRSEITSTLQLVRSIDPNAFTILSDATEVHGEGFKEFEG